MEFVNIKIEKYAIAIRLSIYANIHIHNIFGQIHKRDIKIYKYIDGWTDRPIEK